MKRKFMYALMAFFCCLSLTMASCGGDDEPDDPDVEQGGGGSSNSNPMVGKTIVCREHSSNDGMVIDTDFSITFGNATRYKQKLVQTAKAHGTLIHSLNKEVPGSYEYNGNSITLKPDDGGVQVLKKVDGGWQDGNYIYK